jgi:hypothetical protein
VLALFVTLPCGKFMHGLYRTAALVKAAVEQDDRRSAGRPRPFVNRRPTLLACLPGSDLAEAGSLQRRS